MKARCVVLLYSVVLFSVRSGNVSFITAASPAARLRASDKESEPATL